MTWPYLLLSLRARFNLSAEEFLSLTYWQAVGYFRAAPYLLGVPAEDKPQKKGMTVEEMEAAGIISRG